MSALLPHDDRGSVPTVAIIGNDAVLMAAPATPVQLAHACLRRGFGVAVPVSWGDELVASEAMRRLATRERGPAVMCVCPFVRSRLLGPGPDLAPFLVSLVSPPVATARYLRTVYGDHGVHITYIGGCPSADDVAIDARLTPDGFLADLAEHGIALAEQPLVFDSIVPPDRRRWCSIPGGTPSAEVLWSEGDTRALLEIERDEVSTELAQHIIGDEHVLLDLAPALGCVCSGAIGSLPGRSARVAVTTVEPPRSFGPVIDPSVVVALDAPLTNSRLTQSAAQAPAPGNRSDVAHADPDAMERRLDQLLGTQAVGVEDTSADATVTEPSEEATTVVDAVPIEVPGESQSVSAEPTASEPASMIADAVELIAGEDAESTEVGANMHLDAMPDRSSVRRRTPVPASARHPSSSIPRATASDGTTLPRAYVAKRRTPPAGMPTVGQLPEHETTTGPTRRDDTPAAVDASLPRATVEPPRSPPEHDATGEVLVEGSASPELPKVAVTDAASIAAAAAPHPTVALGAPVPVGLPTANVPVVTASMTHVPPNGKVAEPAPTPERKEHQGGTAAAAAPNPGAFVILLLALIALAIFVLRALG